MYIKYALSEVAIIAKCPFIFPASRGARRSARPTMRDFVFVRLFSVCELAVI